MESRESLVSLVSLESLESIDGGEDVRIALEPSLLRSASNNLLALVSVKPSRMASESKSGFCNSSRGD